MVYRPTLTLDRGRMTLLSVTSPGNLHGFPGERTKRRIKDTGSSTNRPVVEVYLRSRKVSLSIRLRVAGPPLTGEEPS